MLLALQLTLVGDGLAGADQQFELNRFIPLGAHFDLVPPGVDVELLKHAVEVVDVTDEEAVDENLCLARFDLQPHGPGRPLVISGLAAAAVVAAAAVAAAVAAAAVSAVAIPSGTISVRVWVVPER